MHNDKVWVIWNNSGGELERRKATEDTAAGVITDMMSNSPMHSGDTIVIEERT